MFVGEVRGSSSGLSNKSCSSFKTKRESRNRYRSMCFCSRRCWLGEEALRKNFPLSFKFIILERVYKFLCETGFSWGFNVKSIFNQVSSFSVQSWRTLYLGGVSRQYIRTVVYRYKNLVPTVYVKNFTTTLLVYSFVHIS